MRYEVKDRQVVAAGKQFAFCWTLLARHRGRYIQQDGDLYWIDTSSYLNRTAEDYRARYLRQNDELLAELNQQIAKEA